MSRVAPAVVVLWLGCSLPGQTVWSETAVDVPSGDRPAMAYDAGRAQVVLFSAGETWRRNDASWVKLNPAQSPVGLAAPEMVYDRARGVVVLVGATASGPAMQTWEWDGQTWTRRLPANSPSARGEHGLAYDPGRQRTVLFGGGISPSGLFVLGDTWEWDGTDWVELSPANAPAPRQGHAMAYHAAAGRVVLFGGSGLFNPAEPGETWEWDGVDWIQRTPITSPPSLAGHSLTEGLVPGQLLLFGGNSVATFGRTDTWAWDGEDWTHVSSEYPTPRRWHAAVLDESRQRVLVFGGSAATASSAEYTDTWEWNGTRWLPVGISRPVGRWGHSLVFDEEQDRFLLFGGGIPAAVINRILVEHPLDDTLEWNGDGWLHLDPPHRPPGRRKHGMVWDAARGQAVLFGGGAFTGGSRFLLGDTWVFDDGDWSQVFAASSPSPRDFHAMAYDAAREVTVLFGGYDGALSGETWEWDGVTWTQRSPSSSPLPREGHAMAYDAARGVIVLYGGWDFRYPWFSDTWEWDGTDWTQRFPANSPGIQKGHAMVYDPARRRVVMVAQFGNRFPARTWEWDGVDWVQRASQGNPIWRTDSATAWDPETERVWMVAGAEFDFDGFLNVFDETLEYFTTAPAAYTDYGVGCAGGDGAPVLTAAPFHRPWIGDRFRLVVDELPASGAAGLVFGLSGTQWLGLQLPFSLAGLGMPGCTLFASGELFLPVVNTGGRATVDLSIPNDPTLVGQPFYNQVFAADPGANPRGWIVSNAGEAVMGER